VGYPIYTDRLRIEPLAARDVADFVAYRQIPDVARWESWEPSYSEADARQLVATQPTTDLPPPGEWIQLAVRDRLGTILHGDVAVRRLDDQPDTFEIGYTLAPHSQHQGFATEAVMRVLDLLFAEGRAHRVVAFADARNAPSIKLLQRIGMRHESSIVEGDWFKGEWTTLEGYARLAREHTAAHSAGNGPSGG
jgi:aminoglycoside 6'-N-acetyltransferase